MCGIVGFTGKQNRKVLIKLLKTIQHRGYDDTALYYSRGVNLGMNRFAIIDLSKNLYPMKYRNYVLIYNGEIYNYRELKIKLQAMGVKFKTENDAEIILPLFDIYGYKSFSMLDGMFAICIYDVKRKNLILVRDKSGEKPLYFYKKYKKIIFASEIRTILSYLSNNYLNISALPSYLSHGAVYGSETLLKNVNKVNPSQFKVFNLKNGKCFSKEYWHPGIEKAKIKNKTTILENKLSDLIEMSVNRQLVADVPVGCFLSGGVDSSLVAYFASRSMANLKTFSISFPNSLRYDESFFARKAANFLGTDHTEISCTAGKCRFILENIGRYIDEPIVDPAMLPTLLLAKEARRHVKVVLTGLGADELFGGYYRYQKELVKLFFKNASLGKEFLKLMGINRLLDRKNYSSQTIWTRSEMKGLLEHTSDFKLTEVFPKVSSHDPLTAMQLVDYRGYLAEQILTMEDKSTMVYNLEARSPYLDPKIISFALSLPSNLKINGIYGKYLLRMVAENFLPKSIAWRLKKGFSLPINTWFRGELKNIAISSLEKMRKYDSVFDPNVYKNIITEHMSGRVNHGNKIFSIVTLMSWLDFHEVRI